MTEQNSKENEIQDIPEAMVHTRRQISIVWLVPIVAILIGGWLAYKGLSEKGPMVTISFESAEGLEAGKTKVRYKDVELGLVETVRFNVDLTPDRKHEILGRAPPGNRQWCLGVGNPFFRCLYRYGPGKRG
jgi:paraquat-inducible protein B